MKSALAALWVLSGTAVAFQPVLPTDNDALFRGQPENFYTPVDRNFEGRVSTPWEGGTYGFTRGPERLNGRVVLTKFHEGIDISPTRRDASGEPLDEVRSIEAGRVVHLSNDDKDSNYGKYVVVEHTIEGTPVFSIYAHLATIDVRPGQSLSRGETIGRLGYTGAGINQHRAHLHLELALLWHDDYQTWHDTHFKLPNKHGIYNGMNLIGIDLADFYLRQRRTPSLTLRDFLAGQPACFRVQIPADDNFQVPRRYPWLVHGNPRGARSWIVSFSNAGVPLKIEPSAQTVAAAPQLEWAAPSPIPYAKTTRSLLNGYGKNPQLGDAGKKLLQLLTGTPASDAPDTP